MEGDSTEYYSEDEIDYGDQVNEELYSEEQCRRFQEHKSRPENTILNNNNLVGRNCLTFITSSIYGNVRYKFYNKFVPSIESPSVRGKVGNHFSDWIDNPEQILKESINKCKDAGILRL